MDEFDDVDDVVVEDAPKERDWEAEASSMGWNKEFDGASAVDAREFVLRKPLFDDLKKQRRKIKELETAIRSQEELKNKLLEKQKQESLKELRKARGEAISEGDGEKVNQIEEEMEEVQKQETSTTTGPPPEYFDWLDKNDWYEKDEVMQDWADARGYKLSQKYPNDTLAERLEKLTQEAKKAFPEAFENKNRKKPPSVESGETMDSGDDDEPKRVTIPKENKRVFQRMFDAGAWGDVSKKEAAILYMKDLEKVGN